MSGSWEKEKHLLVCAWWVKKELEECWYIREEWMRLLQIFRMDSFHLESHTLGASLPPSADEGMLGRAC